MQQLAPIVLFVYNRPWHTKQTVEALQKNEFAGESQLFIYADGLKYEEEKEKVNAVRNFITSITGFKKVTIVAREQNIGLANSIITGVTEIVNKYGKVIVMEDDLVSSPYFLRFMNEGLNFYEKEESVCAIQGYIFPVKGELPETFFMRGADCWGWATWKRAWDLFEPDGKKLLKELKDRKLERKFNINDTYPYVRMLEDQINGRNNSWAIRWHASVFLKEKFSLYPGNALIKNIGFDNTGTHCCVTSEYDVNLKKSPVHIKKIPITEDITALKKVEDYMREIHSKRNSPKNLMFRILKKLKRTSCVFKHNLKDFIKPLLPKPLITILKRLGVGETKEKASESYPRIMGNEIEAVSNLLKTSKWNLHYGSWLAHHQLEEEFAAFVGTKYAVAVNTGGMALQMALRGLGVKPGDEVLHQVDTCVADPFAIIAAGGTPLFVDTNTENFMLSRTSLESTISPDSRVIVPIHMWGNPENMDMVMEVAQKRKLFVLEDACLSFGAEWKGKKVGSIGHAGVFSFGVLKPMQAGEGGMIVTNDEGLAKELRTIRIWGDRSHEYGVRDQEIPSWNGRMSEIVAVVVLEQLRGYQRFINDLQESVEIFANYLKNIEGIEMIYSGDSIRSSVYTQVVVKIDEKILGCEKRLLMDKLSSRGIAVWHGNFEPLTTLSFFHKESWRQWIIKGDLQRVDANYKAKFANSERIYSNIGLGFSRTNFLSKNKVENLIDCLDELLLSKRYY